MIKSIEETFRDVEVFASDVWVADYTEAFNQRPAGLTKAEMDALPKGVYIQGTPFPDIEAFHLRNKAGVEIYAVNFEHNKDFFAQGMKDCECMFRNKGSDEGWVLFCELKYCKEKNISTNASKAYKQLKSSWQQVVDATVFDPSCVRSYLNISVPKHNHRAPFEAFVVTPNDELEWMKKNKIHLLGYNQLIVVDADRLKVERPVL